MVRGFAQSAWRLNDASRQRLGPALASEVARLVAILLRGEEEEGDEAGAAEGGRRGTDWLYRDRQPDPELRRRDAAECRAGGAAAAHLLGYVHRILARHDTSFGEQLREAHLQQAYEMLADARLNHLTIKEVMYRAGFSNFSTSVTRSGSVSAVPPASCASAGRRPPSPDSSQRLAVRPPRANKSCTPTTFPPGGVDILAASDFNPRGTR